MPLKAVAFDVDGTLYPNSSMYFHSMGLALANIRLLKALERARAVLRAHPDLSDDFHRVQAQLVAQELGLAPERAYALIEGRVYTRWYKTFRKLRPYPGAEQVLKEFRHAGLKLAAMSDFPIRGRLKDLGLAGYWDCAFSSEETGYLKPHTKPFEVLAQKLNLEPAEILYVGNSYTYDVMGSKAAGMACAHLTRIARPRTEALFSFFQYDQLRDFVFRCLDNPNYNVPTGRVPS